MPRRGCWASSAKRSWVNEGFRWSERARGVSTNECVMLAQYRDGAAGPAGQVFSRGAWARDKLVILGLDDGLAGSSVSRSL